MDKLNTDLLVLVLAILTDTAPQAAVSEALRSWTQHPEESLVHWFKKSTGLEDSRIRALERLAMAHLKAHQYDLRQSLGAWNAYEVTQDFQTEIQDDALRTTLGASLGGVRTLPLIEGEGINSLAWVLNQPLPPQDGERFRLIRPHAKGGIGQVWVARDGELQREVALKEIQPCFSEREDHKARFLLEAEITGNLEHPGVVPVYSLGRNAEGRPYYAMRFIQGESLQVAIRKFHQARRDHEKASKRGAKPPWGIEFRQLLRRFLDVCDTIDYAHSRSVLHRDLKPANIMLGRYGETLVVDWGLAKVLGRHDVSPAHDNGGHEHGFSGSSMAATGETVQGTLIGTPAYMSPEQARGDINLAGQRSDVYSLGATLYELLTGDVPFKGKKVSEVIEKVLKGDFEHPRNRDRTLPAPLDAICVKAMATDPNDRYDSVRELAQDLEHWLADEPVTAFPEGRLAQLARWLRQHRSWTNAAAAALVGISIAATIGFIVADGLRRSEADARQKEVRARQEEARARQEEAHARQEEAQARQEAETNFGLAQNAVDEYLTSVSEDTLLKLQDSVDLRSLRRRLLNNALNYYKKFVAQRASDPVLRRQLATAYFHVGEIVREIGTTSEAIDAFRSSLNLWQPLAKDDPSDYSARARMADCYLAIGGLYSSADDPDNAMKELTEARQILGSISRERAEVKEYTSTLATCDLRIGIIQGALKHGDQALATLEQAKTIQERLLGSAPTTFDDKFLLAAIHEAIGTLLFERQDFEGAFKSFQEAGTICQRLADGFEGTDKPVKLLDLLALSHYNTGAAQIQKGEFDHAQRSFERSLDVRRALMDDHPSVTQFQEQLGKNLAEIALLFHAARQDEKAVESINRSIELLEKLVRGHADRPVYRADLARSWNIRGYFLDDERQNRRAIEALERARTEQLRTVAEAPATDWYVVELCNIIDNLGEQYIDLGEPENGLPLYRDEVARLKELCNRAPTDTKHAVRLATALAKLGNVERHIGELGAAMRSFQDGQAAIERVGLKNDLLQSNQAALRIRQATILNDQKKANEAIPILTSAIDVLSHTKLSDNLVADDQARASLSEGLWELARAYRATGETAKAELALSQQAAVWQNQPALKAASLALTETAAQALVIGYGKTPLSDQARAIRELDLDRAARHLKLAISRGFSDPTLLKNMLEVWALPILVERAGVKLP